ncbi:hypothetical protein [Fluviicola sp.]|uniref:hypothetical protein n=1 Tax=Fluviicola sp. TaxID=1917219 RepID=UPI0031E264D1
MKPFLLFALILFSKLSYADGLDELKIYVNSQLVATVYEGGSQTLELPVSIGDTLKFVVSTDWGGMEESTIGIFDHGSSEQLVRLNRIQNNEANARFQHIIRPDLVGSELLMVFNFSPRVNRTWKFARAILKTKTD